MISVLICGASVTGKRHAYCNQTNQDAFAWKRVKDEGVILAIADGAGSYPETAHLGAKFVVEYVCEKHESLNIIESLLAANPGGDIGDVVDSILRRLVSSLQNYSTEKGLDISQMSTTFSMVVILRSFTVVISIGDSVIAALPQGSKKPQYILCEKKINARNYTNFLHSYSLNTQVSETWQVLPRVEALSLSTDGLVFASTYVDEEKLYNGFFEALWEKLESGAMNEKIRRVFARHSGRSMSTWR